VNALEENIAVLEDGYKGIGTTKDMAAVTSKSGDYAYLGEG
jgi:O-acetylhomoserine/O-acetylserine sulfhydrylase-like pyridoxal-dependent enzyme